MPFYKDEALSCPVNNFIALYRDQKTTRENIRINSNQISILDDQGQIIQQIVPLAKILPINLENQQLNQRTLLNSLDSIIRGMNITVLFIGSSFSGKQKLFDGNKNELPLSYHFLDRLIPSLRQKFRKFEIRMKTALIVKQKIYDCNSENKYATLKLRQNEWQGIQIVNMNVLPIDNIQDYKKQIQRIIKQKNRLILQFKDLYTSYLELTIIRDGQEEHEGKIISNITFIEVPGVQLLSESHNTMKNKESSLSTKSLINFTSIMNQLNKNSQSIPQYDSVLGNILKEKIGSNSHLFVYYTLRSEDIEGSLGTIKLMRLTDNLQQYPITNSSNTFGLIRRFRAEMLLKKGKAVDKQNSEDKNFLQNQIMRVKTQDDYNRLLEKYSELKNKYNKALKLKSQAQLELIKSQEQKLEIGKSLVQVQIQNTKLLQKLQNKDYENGKRILQTQNKLAKKQNSYQECIDKIQQLTLSLNEALQTKRDLQVEFIALKRNFIMQQKDLAQLKEDNQNLSLDVINLSNQNERLKKDFLNKTKIDDKSRLYLDIHNEKYDELKRQNKRQEENINYLKSQIQRYKKQLIERQVNFQQNARKSGLSNYGKDYDRIQLQNFNLQLQNKIRLLQRKIEEMQEKVGYYEEQNTNLQDQNKTLRTRNMNDTNEYRKKLQELAKGSNYQHIVKELRQNFARKDGEQLNKLNSLKQSQSNKKKQIAFLKAYIRQLMSLLQQWSPKGVQVPSIKKFRSLNLNSNSEQPDEISDLRIKNMRLEEQVRRLKASGGQVRSVQSSKVPEDNLKQSRVNQEFNYLKSSNNSNIQMNKLREQNSRLAQQNRRLTVMLKDGNKMDLNVFKRQNDNLRKQVQAYKRQIDQYKNKSSISPSTNDQKLIYYEKHLKLLQKQRSQLLSRCVVAEEQVKNLLGSIGKAKR